jgi:hypothetical protein
MKTPRNKSRADGMTLLGVPMPEALKGKIKAAAEIKERTMADWSRLALRDAAEAVIAAHAHKQAPQPEPYYPDLKVAEDETPYRTPNSNGHAGNG